MPDHDQRFKPSSMVQTYGKLSEKEEAEMQAILDSEPEFQDVKESELTWLGKRELRAKTEGQVEARAHDVLMVLDVRGVPISEAARQQILRCTDPALLSTWLKRAAVAQTLDEVLAPTP